MKVLVTGSSGQLGAVISSMLSKAHPVIRVDSLPGKYTTHVAIIRSDQRLEFVS